MAKEQKPMKLSMKEMLLLPEEPAAQIFSDKEKDETICEMAKEYSREALEFWAPQHRQMKKSYRLHSDNCWKKSAFARRLKEGRPALICNILNPIRDNVASEHLMDNFSIDVKPRDASGEDFSTLASQKTMPRFQGLDGTKFTEEQFLEGLINGIFSRSDVAMHFNKVMRGTIDAGFGHYIRMYTDYQDPLEGLLELKFESNPDPYSWLMDPNCRNPDFSDMNYFFDSREMSKEEAKRKYGDRASFGRNAIYETEYDNQRSNYLIHANDRMVKLVEFFHRRKKKVKFVKVRDADGSIVFVESSDWAKISDEMMMRGAQPLTEVQNNFWQVRKFLLAGEEVVREAEVMHGWDEIPVFPMHGISFADEKGRMRYRGLLDPAEDLQHQFNHNMSVWSELTAKGSKTAYQVLDSDKNKAKEISAALRNNELVIPVKSPIQPIAAPAIDRNLIEQIRQAPQLAKEIIGVSSAALGQRTNETSQKGIQARKAESDVGLRVYAYQAKLVLRRMARQVVKTAPLVYDGTRIAVIVGKDGESKPVAINKVEEVMDQQTGAMVQVINNDVTQPSNVDFVVRTVIKQSDSRQDEVVDKVLEVIKITGQGNLVPLFLPFLLEHIGGPGAGAVIRKLTDTAVPDEALSPDELEQKYNRLSSMQKKVMGLKQSLGYQDPPPPFEIQEKMLEVDKAKVSLEIAQMAMQEKQSEHQIEMQNKQLDGQRKQMEIDGIAAANSGKAVAVQKLLADIKLKQSELKLQEKALDAKLKELAMKLRQGKEMQKVEMRQQAAELLNELFDDPDVSRRVKDIVDMGKAEASVIG